MLEWLAISNFQAHEKTRIDFDPKITTIIGPSDVGKSAIIRALRWVCTNQPGGEAFVRHGAAGAAVRLCVDGHIVKRARGGDVNAYYLDSAEYKAFGRAVPDPVEAFLNIGTTSWQQQHDAPYWFSESPGEVSRQLNTIVNLGIIDATLASVSKAVRKAKVVLEVAEGTLTDTKKEYDSLAWVEEVEEGLASVESFAKEAETITQEAARLNTAIKAIHRCTEASIKAQDPILAGERAMQAFTRAVGLQDKAGNINKLIEAGRGWERVAKNNPPTTDKLDSMYSKIKLISNRAGALQALLDDLNQKGSVLCQAEKELKEATKAMPNTCPMCERSL